MPAPERRFRLSVTFPCSFSEGFVPEEPEEELEEEEGLELEEAGFELEEVGLELEDGFELEPPEDPPPSTT